MNSGEPDGREDRSCPCCGGIEYLQEQILWPDLINAWQLDPFEAEYINRQQGHKCTACGSNLRSRSLASAIMALKGFEGTFHEFVTSGTTLRVLEVNEAGNLTTFLNRIEGHVLTSFPDVDMETLPFADATFDMVVHSDTLEHVGHPVRGLAECRRVLVKGGATCFTVPLVTGRLTRSRAGLVPSYHSGSDTAEHVRVHTEFGADTWQDVLMAGYEECRIHCYEYPAGLAVIGLRLR